jgi:hypothetical protein
MNGVVVATEAGKANTGGSEVAGMSNMHDSKAGRKQMGAVLFIIIPVLIAGTVWLALRGSKDWPIDELDTGIVETYCRFIAEGRYDEAYEQCLSSAYRRDVSREDFAGAHERVRTERGVLQSRELVRMKSSVNLFSGTRSVQLLYLLRYPDDEWRNYIIVDNADGEWRIEGTYRKTVQNLDYIVW